MTVVNTSSPEIAAAAPLRWGTREIPTETSAVMVDRRIASGAYDDRDPSKTAANGNSSSNEATATKMTVGAPLTTTASADTVRTSSPSSFSDSQNSDGVMTSADRIGMFQNDGAPQSGSASTAAGKAFGGALAGKPVAGTVSAPQFVPSSDAAMHAIRLGHSSSSEENSQELSIRSAATPSQMSLAGRGGGAGGSLYSMDDSIAGEMVDMSQLNRSTMMGNHVGNANTSAMDVSHLNTTTDATMLSIRDSGTPSHMSLAPAASPPSFRANGGSPYHQHGNLSAGNLSSSLRDASTSPASPSPRPSPRKSSPSPAPLLMAATPSPSNAGPDDIPTPPTFGTAESESLIQASSRMMNSSDASFLASPPYANVSIGLSGRMDEESRAEAQAHEDAAGNTNDVSAVSGLGDSNYAPSAPGSVAGDGASASVFSNENNASTSFGSHSAAAVRSNATTVVRSNRGGEGRKSKRGRSKKDMGSQTPNSSLVVDGSFPTVEHSPVQGEIKSPLPGERIPPPGSTLKRERKRKCWRYGICVGLLLGVVAIVLGSLAITGNLGGGQDGSVSEATGAEGASSTATGDEYRPGSGHDDGGAASGDDEEEPTGNVEEDSMEDSEDEGENGQEDDEGSQQLASSSTTSTTITSSTTSSTTEADVVASPTLGPTGAPTTAKPTFKPTDKPTLHPTDPISSNSALISTLTEVANVDPTALRTEGSPQNLAMQWISGDPVVQGLELGGQVGDEGDDANGEAVGRLVQRFATVTVGIALGVLPGATPGDDRALRLGGRALQGASASATGDALKSGWYSVSDECSWPGVECDRHLLGYGFRAVTELNLARMSQVGGERGERGARNSIPPEIGLFSHLKKLDLAENGLEGPVPDKLYDLVNLEGLFLEHNELSGPLGDGIGNLVKLESLYLGNNKLNGSLPKQLTNMRVLRTLILSRNAFSGTFPLLRLRELYYLDASHNRFSGPLPSDLEKYVTMRIVYLDHNDFQGTIPSTYPNIGKNRLMELTLDNNKLCGGVPEGWMHDMKYQKFLLAVSFHNNYLTERLPSDLCELSVLEETGELVELSSDCSICRCTNRWNLCGRGQCESGYEGVDAATRERECQVFEEQQGGDGR